MRVFLFIYMVAVTSTMSASISKIGADAVERARAGAPARVIVALRLPIAKTGAQVSVAVIRNLQDDVLNSLPAGSFRVSARWDHVPAFAGEMTADAIAALEANPSVARVDLDVSGGGNLRVSIPLIGANVVHSHGYVGAGVTVAILDTGIDETHVDLKDALVDEACFCTNANGTGCCPGGVTTKTGFGAAADDHGHGSNVAGIVASRGNLVGVGVAPAAKLVAVKVLDKNEVFNSTSQIISGLDWIIQIHPEVKVINMSLGTSDLFTTYCDNSFSYTMAFSSVINTLKANGVSTFVSSGNDKSATSMEAPACIQSAISVAAVWKADVGNQNVTFFNCTDATTAADQVTCFSNSNSTLDLLAPGAPIVSDYKGGGNSTFWGTSQASPHCAGAAAVLLSINPHLTPDEIEQLLRTTGKPVTDARNGVTTPRINLQAAVAAVPPAPVGSTPPRKRHRAAPH
jgi:subtilisin family serine protease